MTQIPNLAERLARVQADFDAAPDEGDPFAPPPDGDYQCLLHEFDFFEGGTPKQAFMKIRWQVVHHPDQGGRFCETVYTLEDPDRIGYLRADLFKLGENTENFDLAREISSGDLQERLLDVPALIRVKTGSKLNPKTGKPYVGVYVQQRLGDPQRAQRPQPIPGTPFVAPAGSDVPEPAADEFVHPRMDGTTDDTTAIQASLDDVPFTGEEAPDGLGNRNQEAQLREQGCECDDPVAVELAKGKGEPGTGSIECPLPGHAAF